jgi:DNA-binding transcriptional MerR regulator
MNAQQDCLSTRPLKLALSRIEAADALGVSAVTIDRLTKRGLLRPSRATRRPIYAVREIERFLRETTSDLEKLWEA